MAKIAKKGFLKIQAKNFLSVQPTAVGKGKIFFSKFLNFLAEFQHSKTFEEKKNFSKNFQKTLFGNFGHEGGLKTFWSINRKLFSVKNPRGKVVSDLRYLQKCGLQELNSIFGLFFTKISKMPGEALKFLFWEITKRVYAKYK